MNTQVAPGNANQNPLRGPEPQQVDRALAALIEDNYDRAAERRGGPAPGNTLPRGWQRMEDDEVRAAGIDPSLLQDRKSGFDASFYRGADGTVALVYAGTDEGRDWKHNFGQGLGFKDAQYDQAINLAREAKLAFGGNLVLTGQSLGGGLAAAASMVNEVPAVTFNAAGVHDRTIERFGVDAAVAKREANEGLVRHYVVDNDILTHLQERAFPLNLAMPDAPGARIRLPDPDPLTGFEKLLPWKVWQHRVQVHYIEAVMDAMDQAGYTLDRGQVGSVPRENPSPQPLQTANRLLGDAVSNLAGQREALGLQDDARFYNAAAGIAAGAGRDGLRSIDHLVAGNDRNTLFAVQGGLDDAQHQRSRADVGALATTPVEQSTSRLRDWFAQAFGRDGADVQEEQQVRRGAAVNA